VNSHSDRRRSDALSRLARVYVELLIRLVEFCSRRALWVVVAGVLLSAASVYYAVNHFAITTDTSQALSRDLPFRQMQERFDHAFPQLDGTILVVIDGQTSGLASDAARRLTQWLQQHNGHIEDVYQPGGGDFFRKNGLLYLSTDELWALSDRLSQAQPLISQLSRDPTLPGMMALLEQGLDRATGSGPQISGLGALFADLGNAMKAQEQGRYYAIPWDELITGDVAKSGGRRVFVIVKPHLYYEKMQPAQRALDTVREGMRALQLDAAHGVRVRLTGAAALDNEQLRTVSHGTGLAIGLSIGMVLVLLILGLHSARLVIATLVTLLMGLSWTAAFALLATAPLNLISIAFVVLFVGLGVDFGIQFCMRYREEYATHGGRPKALCGTAAGLGSALSLAAVAAAVSFYSFVPTSYAGIVDLGLISGTSMFIALFANLTVLPALLSLMPGTPPRARRVPLIPLWRLPVRRYGRYVAVGAAVIAVGTIPLILNVHFDFNPIHLQNMDTEAVKTFEDLLANSEISPYRIDVLEPDLQHADALAQRLGKLKVVSNAITLDSYVPDDQQQKLPIIRQMALLMPPFVLSTTPNAPATQPAAIRTALNGFETKLLAFANAHPQHALAAPARALAGVIPGYLHYAAASPQRLTVLQQRVLGGLFARLHDLSLSLQATPFTRATLPQSLKRHYVAPSGATRVEVYSTLNLGSNVNMRRFVDAVRAVAPNATGAPVMLVEGGRAVVDAFVEASLISLVLIVLLLLISLQSVVDMFMVLIPLGFAALLMVAAMELSGLSFNLANIIVLPLLIGLGVAFGIYLVVRWRNGVDITQLLRTSTPGAVLYSALTTMSSFGSLAVAGDPGMAVLGKTLLLALTAVLVSILILLPVLLLFRKPPYPAAAAGNE
jgi:hopanoid biosynthesis associated RND transporter like protein HpnN